MKEKATSKDVARRAGVSQTTVSLILNNRTDMSFPETTRRKVMEAAKALNYVPNQFAQGLKTNRSRLIGLLLPAISNPYYQMLAQYIEEAAASYGYNILLCNTSRSVDREESYIDLLQAKSADGLIYTFSPRLPEKALKVVPSKRLVFIGEKDPNLDIRTIPLDSRKAGELVARYLIDLGHRRVAFVTTPLSTFTLARRTRLEGVVTAMREAGLEAGLIVKEGTYEKENNDSSFEIDTGFSLTEELVQGGDNVTAIIGVNDMVAFGALSYLMRVGLRVPEDISVCGFDNIFLSRVLAPHITTVEHYISAKARRAVEMIISSVEGDSELAGDAKEVGEDPGGPVLIARDSTGPALAT